VSRSPNPRGRSPTKGQSHRPKPIPLDEYEIPDEIVLFNTNIRGINAQTKRNDLYKIITQCQPDIICLNETKLVSELYLDDYWSYQTLYDKKGGCWTASHYQKGSRLSLVKSVGNYLCWTRLTVGAVQIQILNCYLDSGDSLYKKNRALRVIEIIGDILR
jgi:hypothetical protein